MTGESALFIIFLMNWKNYLIDACIFATDTQGMEDMTTVLLIMEEKKKMII